MHCSCSFALLQAVQQKLTPLATAEPHFSGSHILKVCAGLAAPASVERGRAAHADLQVFSGEGDAASRDVADYNFSFIIYNDFGLEVNVGDVVAEGLDVGLLLLGHVEGASPLLALLPQELAQLANDVLAAEQQRRAADGACSAARGKSPAEAAAGLRIELTAKCLQRRCGQRPSPVTVANDFLVEVRDLEQRLSPPVDGLDQAAPELQNRVRRQVPVAEDGDLHHALRNRQRVPAAARQRMQQQASLCEGSRAASNCCSKQAARGASTRPRPT